MKKLLGAALAALSLLAVGQSTAEAGDFTFQGQICCHRFRVSIPYPHPCNFFCGCGCASHCGGCGLCNPYAFNQCHGIVTGPWYTFWPTAGGVMTSSYTFPNFRYDDHFQVPAPGPYGYGGGASVAAVGATPAGFQPAGYYPSYWYSNP